MAKRKKTAKVEVRRAWGVTEYGRIMPHVFFAKKPTPVVPEKVIRVVVVPESEWRKIQKRLKEQARG